METQRDVSMCLTRYKVKCIKCHRMVWAEVSDEFAYNFPNRILPSLKNYTCADCGGGMNTLELEALLP